MLHCFTDMLESLCSVRVRVFPVCIRRRTNSTAITARVISFSVFGRTMTMGMFQLCDVQFLIFLGTYSHSMRS